MRTNFLQALGAITAGLTACASASAQTSATTDPVGYAQISCLANSDTRISIPFTRPAEFTGTISAVSAPSGTAPNQTVMITVAASPNWTPNQFMYVSGTQPKTYYAIIGPNLAAMTGTVAVTNGNKTVTGTGTAFLSQLSAGDAILVNGTQATVASVTSDTALTLISNFIGATASGASSQSDRSKKEGSYYTVSVNGSNTLTVFLNGDSLSSLAAPGNTSVTLIPYWTLGTAFPASDAGVSYAVSTGSVPRKITTQILTPNLDSAGINLTASGTYYNYNGNWRLYGQDPGVSYDDTVLVPTTSLIIRNASDSTTFTPVGAVYMNRISAPLDTQIGSQQDNAVAVARPANVTLNELGLITSGAFTSSTGSTPRTITDTLLTFDNTVTGVNKVSNATYFYLNGGWRLYGQDPAVDYGSISIPYGTGFLIRKAVNSTGTTSFWQNARNY